MKSVTKNHIDSVRFPHYCKRRSEKEVETGTKLQKVQPNHMTLLTISGTQISKQDYLIQGSKRIYRMQGVDINDKH